MYQFYLKLWAKWAMRLTITSLFLAIITSLFITSIIYISQGMTSINKEVITALGDVFKFWFPIAWSVTLLISLFRALKNIFNSCYGGYELKLLSCSKEIIETIGYGDLVKVWRKYFMLLVWIVAAQMILSLSFTYILSDYNSLFEWFNIYVLYIFILISSYFSFIILSSKCKQIKVQKC